MTSGPTRIALFAVCCRVLLRFANSLPKLGDPIVLQNYQCSDPTPHRYARALLGLQALSGCSSYQGLQTSLGLVKQLTAAPWL